VHKKSNNYCWICKKEYKNLTAHFRNMAIYHGDPEHIAAYVAAAKHFWYVPHEFRDLAVEVLQEKSDEQ